MRAVDGVDQVENEIQKLLVVVSKVVAENADDVLDVAIENVKVVVIFDDTLEGGQNAIPVERERVKKVLAFKGFH